jgi:hypothetical protein
MSSPFLALTTTTATETAPWWGVPFLSGLFVVAVAVVAFLSLRASDLRKIRQEDKRRWNEQVVDVAMELLVICDDAVSNVQEAKIKRSAIRLNALPTVAKSLMTKLELLTDDETAELGQDMFVSFTRNRRDLRRQMDEESLTKDSSPNAYNFQFEEHKEIRDRFVRAIRQMVVVSHKEPPPLSLRLKSASSLIRNGDSRGTNWAELARKNAEYVAVQSALPLRERDTDV